MSLAERLNGLFVNRVSPPHRGGGPDHPGWGQLGLRCPSGHRKYRSRAPVIVGSNPTRPTIDPDEREDQEHRLPRCEGLATLAQGQHNRKSEIWLVLPKKSARVESDPWMQREALSVSHPGRAGTGRVTTSTECFSW